ncbi:MAG: PorT family protein [Segetibacter sp.]|nr:PorT family protein [Segetibacter sp.]
MKKIILSAGTLCLITLSTIAQVKPSENRGGFMVKAGVNFANLSVTDNGRVDDANMLTSFHAGLGANLPLSERLTLQPALLLTGKGSKTKNGQSTGTSPTYWKATSNPLYVELPVNLVAKIPLDEYIRIYVGAGPYVAAGVGGKNKVEGKTLGIAISSERDIIYSGDNPFTHVEENSGYGKLKRFDYGLNALAGLDFNKFAIGANYGYGLAKINSNTANNASDKGKHRIFSLSLAVKM